MTRHSAKMWSALQLSSQLPTDPSEAREVLKMMGEIVDKIIEPRFRKVSSKKATRGANKK